MLLGGREESRGPPAVGAGGGAGAGRVWAGRPRGLRPAGPPAFSAARDGVRAPPLLRRRQRRCRWQVRPPPARWAPASRPARGSGGLAAADDQAPLAGLLARDRSSAAHPCRGPGVQLGSPDGNRSCRSGASRGRSRCGARTSGAHAILSLPVHPRVPRTCRLRGRGGCHSVNSYRLIGRRRNLMRGPLSVVIRYFLGD